MTTEKMGHFILGITQSGKKFRPSDWIERIASVFASYDTVSQRIHYNPNVMPTRHEDIPCLFVDSKFAVDNPDGCHFIMDFVNSNKLVVKTTVESPVTMCESEAQLQDVA